MRQYPGAVAGRPMRSLFDKPDVRSGTIHMRGGKPVENTGPLRGTRRRARARRNHQTPDDANDRRNPDVEPPRSPSSPGTATIRTRKPSSGLHHPSSPRAQDPLPPVFGTSIWACNGACVPFVKVTPCCGSHPQPRGQPPTATRRRASTSSTTADVDDSPPRSKVRIPSAAAPSVARRMASAASTTAASPCAA